MQYFLDHHVEAESVSCNPEGRQELSVRVSLESTAPSDAARLPDYVVGMAEQLGVPPGSQRVNTHLYAPMGGWIDSLTVDGVELTLTEVEHLGRPVGSATVEVDPGQTRPLRYTELGRAP